eukprot:2221066-Ditylum_brightwellii.AAC.1
MSLIIKNLHMKYLGQFTDKVEHQFKHNIEKNNNIPFFLWMINIAMAFYAWTEEHSIKLPAGRGQKDANQIQDEEEEELTIVNSINQ